MIDRAGILLALALCGCGPAVAVPEGGSSGDTPSPGESTGSETMGPPTTTPTTTTDPGTTTFDDTTKGPITDTAEPGTSDSSGFIHETEGWADGECSVFLPEGAFGCGADEACRPWSNDGGDAWNATRCVPLSDDPAGVGEPCVVESSPVLGIDSCAAGSMCFDVDPNTLQGTCAAYCQDFDNPFCEDPATSCVQGNNESVAVCLTQCDPLLQDCGEGQTCVNNYGVGGRESGFFCMRPGTPYINEGGVRPADCGPGGLAVPTALIDSCEDGSPCCTSFCNMSIMDMCPDGLECTAYDPEGSLPVNMDVGVCLSPA